MENEMIATALKCGFADAAVISTDQIVLNPTFRPYCEENLCGKYGANYSCPPECGSPEEMKQKILKHKKALVLRTVWEIRDFKQEALIKSAKQKHNEATLDVISRLEKKGFRGFMVGASCCSLCSPCRMTAGEPCPFPQKRFSCMSAYCIYVKDLAEKCGMDYDYKDGLLPLFGMYVFDSEL